MLTPLHGASDETPERFRVLGAARRGGTGAVCAALDARTGERVALKVSNERSARARDDVLREASVLTRVQCPVLASLVAHGVTRSGRAWLATRWVDGPTLREWLDESANAPRFEGLLALARRLVTALAALADAGGCHGDLSPANVLLEGARLDGAVLVDAGAGAGFATPGYAAPERIEGADPSLASDLFSLGAVLFEATAREAPFTAGPRAQNGFDEADAALRRTLWVPAPSLASCAPFVPAAWCALVDGLLAQRAEARGDLPSVVRVLDELDELDWPVDSQGESAADAGVHATTRPSLRPLDEGPFCGREAELATLEVERARAHEDGPRVLLLCAGAGMGKSALLRQWRASSAAPARERWVASARRGAGSLSLLAELVRSAASRSRGLVRWVRGLLDGPEVEAVAALLADVTNEPLATPPPPLLRVARADPALMAQQVEWAFGRVVSATLARGALHWEIEDLHAADEASLRVLTRVVRAARGPLFVVATQRDDGWLRSREGSDEERRWGAPCAVLRLDGLRHDEAVALASRWWPAGRAEELDALVARAQGCPLFVEQLARARGAQGLSSLDDLVRARLEARGTRERAVLGAGALLAGRFDAASVSAVLGEDADREAIGAALKRLSAEGLLVREGAQGFSFAHDLLRDAARSLEVPAAEGAARAARAMEWLRARGESAATLALLAEAAGAHDDAAERYRAAAARALLAADFGEAERYAAAGVRVSPEGAIRGALHAIAAMARGWLGRWAEAYEAAGLAMAHAPVGSEAWLRGVTARCFSAFELGRLDEVVPALEQLCDAQAEAEREAELLAWSLGVNAYPLAIARCTGALFARLRVRVDALEARWPTERVRAASLRVRAIVARYLDGALGEALVLADASAEANRVAGDRASALHARSLAAALRRALGDLDRAEREAQSVLDDALAAAASSMVLYARLTLAEVWLEQGRAVQALSEADAALEQPGASSRHYVRAWAMRIAAHALLALGDAEAAEARVAEALRLVQTPCGERLAALCVRVEVALACDAHDAALEAALAALAMLDAGDPVVHDEAGARALYANVLARSGATASRVRAALEHAQRAREGLSRGLDEALKRTFDARSMPAKRARDVGV